MALIRAFQARYKVVQSIYSGIHDFLYEPWFVGTQKLSGKLLAVHVGLLRVSDQVFDLLIKVCLLKTRTQRAKPADQIISFHMSTIFDINEIEQHLSRILEVLLFVGKLAS